MSLFGLFLLVCVSIGIIVTGLPAFIILFATALIGGTVGVITGTIPVSLIAALPGRLVNLLENDLLQALPLFVLMGVLLDRLPVASALFKSGVASLGASRSAPLVAGLGLGALLGPMNGSVGASVLALSRAVAPRLRAAGVGAATVEASVAVASTLGVVVPPSLVLILLGDAMLNAHTIALNSTGRSERIINTQDLLHGVLVPAGLVLASSLSVAWWQGRRDSGGAHRGVESPSRREKALALVSLALLLVLLGGVAAGYFYAVEAAATGAFVLLLAAFAFRLLTIEMLKPVLSDAMATTGALFALLLGATTLTLVLRMLGTDTLVTSLLTALPGGELAVLVTVLALIGVCAFVLDAFEIIFVVIPIVAPPLLMRVSDPVWAATAILLALQTSFLLPPVGYALIMTRGLAPLPARLGDAVRALVPYLLAQIGVLIVVLAIPALVHIGGRVETHPASSLISDADLSNKINDMIVPPPEPTPLDIK